MPETPELHLDQTAADVTAAETALHDAYDLQYQAMRDNRDFWATSWNDMHDSRDAERARADELDAWKVAHLALAAPAGHAVAPEPAVCPPGTDRAGQEIPVGETEAWCTIDDPPPATRFQPVLYVTQEGDSTPANKSLARRNVPDADGFSYRERWDKTLGVRSLWDRELTEAVAAGYTRLAARLISGSKMPVSKMGRTIGGTTPFPCPFETDGKPNAVFIANLKAEMKVAATALLEQAERCGDPTPVLHWPWFAKEWSELYYGTEVRGASGHSLQRFIDAHKAIVDAARALADEFDDAYVTGLQLSGHGPLTGVVDPLASYIAAQFPAEKAMISANGLSDHGQWGQADADVDQDMDSAFVIAAADVPDLPGFEELLCNLQAIQPFGQNQAQYTAAQWRNLYGQVRSAWGDAVEIYMPSFLSDYNVAGALAGFETETARWTAEPRT